MEKYKSYQSTDFLLDDHFVNWVLAPDEVSEMHWQTVFATYPAILPFAKDARRVLLNIRIKPYRKMPESMREELVANIRDHISRSPSADSRRSHQVRFRFGRWVAAACILLTIGFASYRMGIFTDAPVTGLVIVKERAGRAPQKVSNTSDIPLVVLLPDKSTVILDPGANVVYSEQDFNQHREVYLSGEAFFEVERQEPHVPFVVTTDHFTAKVLGTSFRVAASETQLAHRVIVNTGLVEVTTNETMLRVGANQEAIFEVSSAVLSQETMQELTPLSQKAVEKLFNFQAAPLDDVVASLASRYSVSISISDPELAKRTLTASLGELHLHEKLELICRAVEATYTLHDGRIILSPQKKE